jgi:hypothetical protein
VAVHVQLADQRLQDEVGDVGLDLQPDRWTEPAPGQLPLQGLQEVLVAVLLHLEVGVAGHPEKVVLDDLHAGEERAEVPGDEVLEREEPVRPAARLDGDQPGHVVGHLDAGEQLRPAIRVADHDGEVERQPGDVRERVRGVDRQRGEHREDLVAEVVAQPVPLGGVEVRPTHDLDALGRQRGGDLLQEAVGVPAHELGGPLGDHLQLLPGGEPVGAADRQAGLHAPLQAGDPHHVELVQVAGEDGQELGPLQQRRAGILGQRQDARVEVEPGQLPVEETVLGQRLVQRRQRVRRRRGAAGRLARRLDGRFDHDRIARGRRTRTGILDRRQGHRASGGGVRSGVDDTRSTGPGRGCIDGRTH